MTGRGQRVQKRVRSDTRKSRNKLIDQEQLGEKLAVLEGKKLRPIRLIREGQYIKEFELAHFASDEHRRWWRFISDEGEIVNFARLSAAYPPAQNLLFRSFTLQWRIKLGHVAESDVAALEFEELKSEIREVPRKHDPLFIPLYRKISDAFAS